MTNNARITNEEVFAHMPVRRAVFTMVLPTVISQLITVIYNMADTFFIGQMNDPAQVAAATVAAPLFIALTAFANLFGIGGASYISRSLGQGNSERAKHIASFSFWNAAALALLYGALIWAFHPGILPFFGAKADTYPYVREYVFWTVTIGSVPTVLSATLAHLLRAEGFSKEAGFGIGMGGVLNMILDPIFIFAFRLEIKGAAIATMLSNVASTCYFLYLMRKRREKISVSVDPRAYSWQDNIPKEVLLVGFPGFLMSFTGLISNLTMNNLLAGLSTEALAGFGIAKHLDLLAFAIATGVSQGVMPLFAYNYAAKNWERLKAAIRTTFVFGVSIAVLNLLFLYFGATSVLHWFIDDAITVFYGRKYLRTICLICPTLMSTFIVVSIFQGAGRKVQPAILSGCRKGIIDVPLMLLIRRVAGVEQVPWATPFADWIMFIMGLCLILPFWKTLRRETGGEES